MWISLQIFRKNNNMGLKFLILKEDAFKTELNSHQRQKYMCFNLSLIAIILTILRIIHTTTECASHIHPQLKGCWLVRFLWSFTVLAVWLTHTRKFPERPQHIEMAFFIIKAYHGLSLSKGTGYWHANSFKYQIHVLRVSYLLKSY